MMGDRLIGEAPEYTLEQWLRCDALWPHLLSAPQYAHLQAPLHAIARQANPALRSAAIHQLFQQLMRDGHDCCRCSIINTRSAPRRVSTAYASTPAAGLILPKPGCPPPAAGGAVQPAPEPVP